MADCDVNDIICQAGILRNLKELQEGMGADAFAERFPELIDMPDRLSDAIREQILTLKDSISQCGNIEESELAPLIESDFEEEV